MAPEERQRRIREVAERLAERLAEQWPETGADINDLEDFAERMGQDVQRELSEGALLTQPRIDLRTYAGRKYAPAA